MIGQLTIRCGYQVMLYGGAGCLIAALLISFSLPDEPMPRQKESFLENRRAGLKDISLLLHTRPYLFLLCILFFSSLAWAPIGSLKIMILERLGGNEGILGIDSFDAEPCVSVETSIRLGKEWKIWTFQPGTRNFLTCTGRLL